MKRYEFTDVTLRDGLQMEGKPFSIEKKLALLRKLNECGYQRLEITSFVNPKAVPQFADSEAFCRALFESPLARALPETMAFVPNEKGAERLLTFPIPWVACFVSVSEAFNEKNVRSTIDASLAQVEAIVARVRRAKRKVRVYVSTVFGCPYQGKIDPKELSRVLKRVAKAKPDEIALGDTIGVASFDQVTRVLAESKKHFPIGKTALHFHNTYGLAVAAAHAGLKAGVTKFDGTTGGVGGCPYAKGATGNVALEDLQYSLFRDGKLAAFPSAAFRSTLEYLSKEMGLTPTGRLAEVWKKGGDWYGAH